MLANMPNKISRRKFGQGLPPVSVNLKKNERKWQRLKIEIRKIRQKTSIFLKLFIQFLHLTRLQKRQTMLDKIAVACWSAPSLPKKVMGQKTKNVKKGQRHHFWHQKLSFWSTKNVLIKKRQRELLLISSFGGRMQNLGRIVWFNSEIVIFVKVFYA